MAVSALTPAYLHDLSDQELIALLPASAKEKYRARTTAEEELTFEEEPEGFIKPETRAVLDELWIRHFPPVEPKARGKLRRICPHQYPDVEEFVGDSLSLAYFAFIRRIVRQEYENFGGYVYTLILNVGRDKARSITGERGPVEQSEQEQKAPRMPSRSVFVSVDDAPVAVSKGKTPLHEISEEQLIGIIKRILRKHAETNPFSTRTVVLRGTEDYTWDQVAEEVFPAKFVDGSLHARVGRVRTLFKKDRAELIPDFEKYGITSEHVFHFKEVHRGSATEPESE